MAKCPNAICLRPLLYLVQMCVECVSGECPCHPVQVSTAVMPTNTSWPLPLPSDFLRSVIQFSCVWLSADSHTRLLLCCQAQSEAGSVLIFSHLCQAPCCCCCCCCDGLPAPFLPLPSFPAPGPPRTPRATDAQCAAQSICHQLSAFSRAMKCGKMGQGREGGKGS